MRSLVRSMRYANRRLPLVGIFCFEGDSLTEGYPDVTPPPTSFASRNPTATVSNVSTGGHAVGTHMIPDAAAQVDFRFNGALPWNWAILWGGTNDMVNEGRSAITTHGFVQTWCQARKAAGFRVAVCNCIRRVDLSEVTRSSYNSLLLANWRTYADAFVDLAAVLDDWTTKPTLWQVDQIHITSTAASVVAQAVESSIRGVTG